MNPDEFTASELKRIGGGQRRKYLKADPLKAKQMVRDARKDWVTPDTTPLLTMLVGLIMTAPVGIARAFNQSISLDSMPTFILGIMLVIVASIGLGVNRIQTYTRDCIRYRGYIDDER